MANQIEKVAVEKVRPVNRTGNDNSMDGSKP